MKRCDFLRDGDSWACGQCGRRVRTRGETPPIAVCRSVGVPLLQKAANFATSAAKHVAAGMPQATQEQIDQRFAICQACELFDGKACTKCGCPVVREQQFVSKLSWANERCPVGKWGPVNQDSQP